MGNLIICSIAVSFVVVYNVRALIFEQIIILSRDDKQTNRHYL